MTQFKSENLVRLFQNTLLSGNKLNENYYNFCGSLHPKN